MPRTLPLVALDAATLSVDGHTLLHEIQLEVRPGEIWQIHGAAGSGKSLLLELLFGRHRLSSGKRSYPAFVADSPDAAIGVPPRFALRLVSSEEQRRIAVDQATFYQARWHTQWTEPRTIEELLSPPRVMGLRAYEVIEDLPMRRDFGAERERALAAMGLEQCRAQTIGQLSNGELRKLLLIAAYLAAPRLMLLDDPLGGLDPQARLLARDLILRFCNEGQTLVYCSNHADDLGDAATHHLELERGHVQPHCAGKPAPKPESSTAGAAEWSLPLPSSLAPSVRCRQLRVTAFDRVILERIDWEIYPGEHWICTGPNGAGKSTLLALLTGDHPQAYSNQIDVFGKRLGQNTTLSERRQLIGYVAPELGWHYPLGWSVEEVVLSGFDVSVGAYRESSVLERDTASGWLDRFELARHGKQPLAAISEGERRLVLLARALVREPPLLLLDEPTQDLAARDRERFFDRLDVLAESAKTTIVLVTHHFDERPRCINRHLALWAGHVAACRVLARDP
jgi:molybdate transport system ATP-binding protein